MGKKNRIWLRAIAHYVNIQTLSLSLIINLSYLTSFASFTPTHTQSPTIIDQTSGQQLVENVTGVSIPESPQSIFGFSSRTFPTEGQINSQSSLNDLIDSNELYPFPSPFPFIDQLSPRVAKGGKKRRRVLTHKTINEKAEEAIEAFIAENPLQKNLSKKLLEVAKRGNNPKIVEMLIKAGADIHASTRHGNTPLHLAVDHGQTATVEMLLKNGADIEAVNNLDRTPLHTAANDEYPSIVKRLLDAGAKIEAVDNRGMTPLHLAAARAKKNNTRTCKRNVELLLAAAARKDAVDKNGKTPLDLAREKGHEEIVEMLRKDRSNSDKDNETLLHMLIHNHNKADDLKADVNKNIVTKEDLTPFYTAIQKGHKAIVELLLQAGTK